MWTRLRGACLPFLLLSLLSLVHGDMFNQVFQPICPGMPDPPPPGSLLRWSFPATWQFLPFSPAFTGPLPPGFIPGVGAAGAGSNVTIPCGVAVLLDVPFLNLTVLDIQGYLTVEDPVPARVYSVYACWVVVEGQLSIGTQAKQFASKITFTLKPNPIGRQGLKVPGMVIPNRTTTVIEPSTANVGHKAFAIVGGSLNLHGMPVSGSSPSWVKLIANAKVGDTKMVVDQDVSQLWPVGSDIAVASSDYLPSYVDRFRIVGYGPSAIQGTSTILLDHPFVYNHWGDPFGLPDGFGGYLDQRAEVGLLSRNIHITAVDEPAPYDLEGGHFIFVQTQRPSQVEGVEFSYLGQQGTLGRYSFHFHVCGNLDNKFLVKKNSIHESKQRCVVLHATHNVTVDSFVAFNTSAHCYMTEEGSEQDNTFINNLGFLTKKPLKIIMNLNNGTASDESDGAPSTFWISSMQNSYINNVAAGSEGSGFWPQTFGKVRGMSLEIPELQDISPLTLPAKPMIGNVLHSNFKMGFQSYDFGLRAPHTVNTSTDPNVITSGGTYLIGFNVYKHMGPGMFIQASDAVVIMNSTFADNSPGVSMISNEDGHITNCRFVGYSNNLGTPPAKCAVGTCAPVGSCSFPPASPSQTRSIYSNNWRMPLFGVIFSGTNCYCASSTQLGRIENSSFYGYNNTCFPSAAIADGFGTGFGFNGEAVDAATSLRSIKLAPGVPAMYMMPPAGFNIPDSKTVWRFSDAIVKDAVFRDRDGSAVGGSGGYFVANNSFLLPPASYKACTAVPGGALPSNSFACRGVCYRTIVIGYSQPPTPYTSLLIVRDSDNATRALDGQWFNGTTVSRRFYLSLLANETYSVYLSQPANSTFFPDSIFAYYYDGWGADQPCNGAISLRFMPGTFGGSFQWTPSISNNAFWKPCSGLSLSGNSAPWYITYTSECFLDPRTGNYTSVVVAKMGPTLPRLWLLQLFSTSVATLSCTPSSSALCGVIPPNDWYMYNNSGLELHGPNNSTNGVVGYQSTKFNDRSWSYAKAIIGFVQTVGPPLATRTAPGGKYGGVSRFVIYFRKSFSLDFPPLCYSALILDYIPSAGLAVFLNGVEIFRRNLLNGTLTNTNFSATADTFSNPAVWLTAPTIPLNTPSTPSLVSGTNVLAYETHVASAATYTYYFDSRISLINACAQYLK